MDIALDPNDNKILYIVSKRGLMKGQAEGTEWSDITTLLGFDDNQNERVSNLTFSPEDSSKIYFTLDGAMHKSREY